MKIRHLKNNEIDYKAYDFCIENSSQGTVYAMSWYLDIVSPGWELLMADDYNYVMPIPVKKKLFFKYAVQPLMCQQLGVFSLKELFEEIFINFIQHIPYKYYYLQFNAQNLFNYQWLNMRSNHILNLNKPYEEIKKNYRDNCKRNIKKGYKSDLTIIDQVDIEDYLIILKNNSEKVPIYKEINKLRNFIKQLTLQSSFEGWSVYCNDMKTILSCVFFYQWKNRIYYLFPVSTPLGKSQHSMSILLDRFIQDHSNRDLILDFEGSSVKTIAYYYEGFGAINTPYPCLKKFLI